MEAFTLKLAQLQYFQAVCKYNNVTRAAENLHISQPSVSNAIHELETEFGVNLFHRLNKHLSLTMEGEYFLEQANEILDKVDKLSSRMSDFGNNKKSIKIGVPPMIGTFLFPSIFSKFKALYPQINLEIVEYGSTNTTKLVYNDTLDLAVVITNEINNPELNILNILDTQVQYCVNTSNKFANCDVVDVNMIKDEPIVLMKEGSYQNTLIKNMFKSQNLVPNVILASNQLYTIKNFISNNIASAFLLKEVVDKQSDIVGIPLKEPIHIKIGLI